MTVIIGKVDKKSRSVVLAGDSLVTLGLEAAANINKIYRSGDFYIGCAGNLSVIQALKSTVTLPSAEMLEKEGVEVNAKFISSQIVPIYKKVLKSAGLLEKYYAPVQLLIAFKDKLFEVYSDFTVMQREQASIGSGCQSALASLEIGNFNYDIKKKAMLAIKYATIKNRGCGMPGYLVDTKENVFYVFNDNLELKIVNVDEDPSNQW